MKRLGRPAIAGLLALSLSGCATVVGIGNPRDESLLYLGTRLDVDAAAGSGSLSCRRYPFPPGVAWIDLPFSIAADTVLLPFTLIYEVFRPRRPE